MTGRELIDSVSAAVKLARSLRYENPDTFADVTTKELEVVARGLRAVAYSCQEGARLLDRIVYNRSKTVTELEERLEAGEIIEIPEGDYLLTRIVDDPDAGGPVH